MLRRSLAAYASLAGAVACLAQAPAAPVTEHGRDTAQRLFVEGGKAVAAKDLARALDRFSEAAALDPGNATYTQAVNVARQNRITELVQASGKARLQARDEEASQLLRQAFALDKQSPEHNPMIAERLDELARDKERAEEATQPALLNAHVDTSQAAPELVPRPVLPQSFHLYAPSDQILRAVFSAFGLTPILDKSVATPGGEPGQDARVHYDQDNIGFAEALHTAELATNTFAVPLDTERALVALDTKENRTKYERLTEETIYLPGLTQPELQDVSNVAKNVFGAAQASASQSSNTLVVRMPPAQLKPFNASLTEMLAGKSEVVLNVDFYEVDRTRTIDEGGTLPNSGTLFNVTSELRSFINNNETLVQEIISEGLASPGNYLEIAEALIASGAAGSTVLSSPFAYFGGGLTLTGLSFNGASANLSYNVSDTHLLDSIQLRALDGEESTFKVGERYPFVTSSYSNLAVGTTALSGITAPGLSSTLAGLGINAASLLSSATTPQVQYQDLGLSLRATPRVEGTHDVTLKVALELTSLTGQMLNSNPILNSRKYESFTTLKPGEQAIVVSALSEQESHALTGIPFLSEIPGFHLWTNDSLQDMRYSLVIIITPQIVRLGHREQAGPMLMLSKHS